MRMKIMGKAKQCFEESVCLSRSVAEYDDSKLGGVAISLVGIAEYNIRFGTYENAEHAWKEAFAIYRRLAKSDPGEYEPSLAWALSKVGFSMDSDHIETKEQLIVESLGIYERLFKVKPEKYAFSVAKLKKCVAGVHLRMQHNSQALSDYREAIAKFQTLSNENWDRFGCWLVDSYVGLLSALVMSLPIQKVDEDVDDALKFARRLYEENCKTHGAKFCSILKCAAKIHAALGRDVDARQEERIALKIENQLKPRV
jgi:tetratricopeptide (TPR) repeat protein